VICPPGTHTLEGTIANNASDVCIEKRNCSVADLPHKYQVKCQRRGDNPTWEVSQNYFRPYTIEAKAPNTCVLDTKSVDT
jgi:hypothetical protein